jgi:hypothetical protein
MHNLEYVASLKRDPTVKFSLMHSRHAKYSQAKHCRMADGQWLEPSLVSDPQAYLKFLEVKERRAMTETRNRRTVKSARQHHKARK